VVNSHFVVADSHSNKEEQPDAFFQLSVGAAIAAKVANGDVHCDEQRLFKA